MITLPPCPDCGAEIVDAQLQHDDTCPYGNGLDAVTDGDREYFEAHPDASIRVRPITHAERIEYAYIDGIHAGHDARIVVHNIRPGFRTRTLVTPDEGAGVA